MMKLVVILPDGMLERGIDSVHMNEDGTEVTIDLATDATEKEKHSAERRALKDRRFGKAIIAIPQEQQILEAWNNSDFIKAVASGKITDARNRVVKPKDMKDVQPALRRALKELGTNAVLEHMRKYLAACTESKHIWDGTNHGYKHLGGFLRKIVRYKSACQTPWWERGDISRMVTEIEDLHPKTTQRIADAYASEFMGASSYNLSKFPKDHIRFTLAARIVAELAELQILPFAKPVDSLVEHIMGCARSLYGDKSEPVYPGHITSETFWQKAFPQYLYENLGLPSDVMDQIATVVSGAFNDE